jgi:hypothetical protein
MNRIFLFVMLVFLYSCKSAAQTSQSSRTQVRNTYEVAMGEAIKSLDTISGPQSYLAVAGKFERIATAEKNKWEAYYFAAYCYAVMSGKAEKNQADMLADKADELLEQAKRINDNSETTVLEAMIVANRIQVDPMSRFPSKAQALVTLLEKAKQQDPANPRSYYLHARIMIKVPEGMGGGKTVAGQNLEMAVEKYKSFAPAGSIAPNWGYKGAVAMLEGLKKE